MTDADARQEFANRLSEYWKAALEAMSQGGNHTITVDPTFVDDMRTCEVVIRAIWKSSIAAAGLKNSMPEEVQTWDDRELSA
jgi:hypothetical protein